MESANNEDQLYFTFLHAIVNDFLKNFTFSASAVSFKKESFTLWSLLFALCSLFYMIT